jgi:hypothetical protein
VAELRELESKTVEDPSRACSNMLPAAIRSGRFESGSWGIASGQSSISWDELATLKTMLKHACACKQSITAATYFKQPVQIQALPEMRLDALVAVAASLNQSPDVQSAVHRILAERLPTASPDDLATLYSGEWRTATQLKFPAISVYCEGKDYRVPYTDTHTGRWAVERLIEDRRTLLLREDSARLAREQQEKATRQREKEEAVRQQTPEYWSSKLEPQLRLLVARLDHLTSLSAHGYATLANDTVWPEAQAAMMELCSTITAMKEKAPYLVDAAVQILVKRFAYIEGDQAAGAWRSILDPFLKGDCKKTMPWMHQRP